MKHYGIKPLVWVLLLAVVLSSCAAPVEQTPAPQESESTTTTTTAAEVETTTTAETTETTTEPTTTEATVTEPTTTTTTTEATTTKKTTKTPTKTTKATTVKTTRTKKPSTTGKPTTVITKPTTTTKLSAQELVDQLFSLPTGASREGVALKGTVAHVQSSDFIRNQATFILQVKGTTGSHEIYCYQVTPAAGTALVVSPGDPLILSGTVRNNNGTIEFHPAEYTNTLNSHGHTTYIPTTRRTTDFPTNKTTKPTPTTTRVPGPYDPYEVKKPLPAKNKRCLVLKVEGEDLEMAFDRAMAYPELDERVMWHYVGTTPQGVTYTCVVAAETERLYQLSCDIDNEAGTLQEYEAQACFRRYLEQYGLSVDADAIGVIITHSRPQIGPNGESIIYANCSVGLTLEEKALRVGGSVMRKDGALFIKQFTISSLIDGEEVPYYAGDDIPLLIPRWKSE